MRVVLQPETEQVVLSWSKLTLITLILEKIIGLLWLKFVTTYLSCRMGKGGIRELLDGKIWEWDLSFRWEWEWTHWNGRELVQKICSCTPLVWTGRISSRLSTCKPIPLSFTPILPHPLTCWSQGQSMRKACRKIISTDFGVVCWSRFLLWSTDRQTNTHTHTACAAWRSG